MITQEASDRAKENFVRVCKAIGANPDTHTLQVGGTLFTVSPRNIVKRTPISEQITCYYVADQCRTFVGPHSVPLPAYEAMATAMLLLHNDPTIFDRWAKQDGAYA